VPNSLLQRPAFGGLLPDFEHLNFAKPPQFSKPKRTTRIEKPGIIFSRAPSNQAGLKQAAGSPGAFCIKLILASRARKRKRKTGKRSERVAERLSGFRDYEKTW
jgi:hypothetical protein